jgi:hypothetical protein
MRLQMLLVVGQSQVKLRRCFNFINASKSVVINGSNVAKTSTALLRPTAGQVAKF